MTRNVKFLDMAVKLTSRIRRKDSFSLDLILQKSSTIQPLLPIRPPNVVLKRHNLRQIRPRDQITLKAGDRSKKMKNLFGTMLYPGHDFHDSKMSRKLKRNQKFRSNLTLKKTLQKRLGLPVRTYLKHFLTFFSPNTSKIKTTYDLMILITTRVHFIFLETDGRSLLRV